MLSTLLLSTLLGAGPLPGPDVGSALQTVRQTFLEDGAARVAATATHRVIAHEDGSLELQGEQPLRIALQSVRRERGAACRTRLISSAAETNTITSRRACGVEERWTNERDGLAQAFVVERAPPGTGGLTLRLSVEGPWHHQDDQGHVFKGPGAAALLRYGNAFVVREGQRLPIAVVHVEGGLELRIPQAMVDAKNAFPMLIDPLLSAEVPLNPIIMFSPLATSEEQPAIAVNGAGVAMVVWVDGRRALSRDIFGARLSSTGALVDPVGIAIVTGPGEQQRPTICATGESFFVAWDEGLPDGGSQVSARPVSAAGVPGMEFVVGPGSQPSVTNMGDAGVLLAMVDHNAAMQILPIRGDVVSQALPRISSVGEICARPVITSRESSWFAAWESSFTGSLITSIKGVFDTEPLQDFVVYSNVTMLPARRPTAALSAGSNGGEAHVFWEQGANVQGRVVDGNSGSLLFFASASSPAAVSSGPVGSGEGPLLGLISGNKVKLIDLKDGGVGEFAAGLRVTELVLARGPRLFGAWTESPFASGDVKGALIGLSPANTQLVPVSTAAAAQRSARVAMREGLDEGLAVWVEGSRIRGAKVRIDAAGVSVGSSYLVADPFAPIEQLEVSASGTDETFLITWRTLAGSLVGQRATVSGVVGSASVFSALGATAGPAVAWDEATASFRVVWSREEMGVFEVVSRTLTVGGQLSAERMLLRGQTKALALTCLRGACLLAYERPNQTVEAVLIDFLGPMTFVRTGATQPAVAHDGQNFIVGWLSDNSLQVARLDPVIGVARDLPGWPLAGNGNLSAFSLASAQPPVVSWAETTDGEETNVYLHRVDFQGPAQQVAQGFSPALATTGVQPDASGVVVYQRYVATDGLQAVRAFGTRFSFAQDAGTPDAGGVDAGTSDAGTSDGGSPDAGSPDAGSDDAGTTADGGPMIFETIGCTCQSVSSAPLVLLGLLALRRRRQLRVTPAF
ncbi:MAG: hypothetical protein Q8K32_31615 [Archangium sp.]|nr:hypothetical protein [Archangium sp.]